MTSIAAVVLVLGGLIFFHELGHFLVARILGIGVHIFSLGFGPRLVSWQRGETEYRISLIPLGGYVHLAGERADQEDTLPQDRLFSLRPPWQRMLVVAAGPASNFLLAWIIFWGLFATQGLEELLPIVGTVNEGSPAAEAGLQPHDRILAVNSQPIRVWEDLVQVIERSHGQQLTLQIARDNTVLTLAATPRIQEKRNLFGEVLRVPMLGISPSGEIHTRPLTLAEAAWQGVLHIGRVTHLMVLGIIKLIERVIPWTDVGGVILISEMIHRQAQEGLVQLLALTALISVNLGVLNLLPIPVLDGGHILFYLLEIIMGRPLPPSVQQIALRLGLAFLLLLMIVATINDILRHVS